MDGDYAAREAPDVGRTRWFRLIPVAMAIYIISFMDRSNIGYAFAGIGHDFHVGRAAQGWASGIFFLGYVTLQIPGGWLAEVGSYPELLVARFILGVAEGGIWPAILVLISHWFPVSERARAYSFWMANLAIASIITQPLSGWIVSETSWRALFYLEGALPFVIALPLWLLFVKDRPRDASWCSAAEREYIETSLRRDQEHEPKQAPFAQIFRTPTVWLLIGVYFLIQTGFYGLNQWLPTLIKTLTKAGFGAVGLIATLPYLTAIGAMVANGVLADRSGKYPRHVLMAMVLASVSLVLSVVIGHATLWLSLLFLCLAMGGALSYDGPFWATASRALPPVIVGGAMGFINALGNLGGALGPYVSGYLQELTGGFVGFALFLSGSMLAAGLLMMTVRVREAPRPVTQADLATAH